MAVLLRHLWQFYSDIYGGFTPAFKILCRKARAYLFLTSKNKLFFALFSRIIGIFANPLFLREVTN